MPILANPSISFRVGTERSRSAKAVFGFSGIPRPAEGGQSRDGEAVRVSPPPHPDFQRTIL